MRAAVSSIAGALLGVLLTYVLLLTAFPETDFDLAWLCLWIGLLVGGIGGFIGHRRLRTNSATRLP